MRLRWNSTAHAKNADECTPCDHDVAWGHFAAKAHGTSALKFRGECALCIRLSTAQNPQWLPSTFLIIANANTEDIGGLSWVGWGNQLLLPTILIGLCYPARRQAPPLDVRRFAGRALSAPTSRLSMRPSLEAQSLCPKASFWLYASGRAGAGQHRRISGSLIRLRCLQIAGAS